jgi:hypothetical protein
MDTKIGCFIQPEVGHAETEVHPDRIVRDLRASGTGGAMDSELETEIVEIEKLAEQIIDRIEGNRAEPVRSSSGIAFPINTSCKKSDHREKIMMSMNANTNAVATTP